MARGLRVATLATRHALGATGAARPMGAFSTGVRVDWGISQQPVRVDCGLSYSTLQVKAQSREVRLWLVTSIRRGRTSFAFSFLIIDMLSYIII